MPRQYFLIPYEHTISSRGQHERTCAIETADAAIRADLGDYALAEIDGDQALCLVRAAQPTLEQLRLAFQTIPDPSSVWTPTYRTWRMRDGAAELHPTRRHRTKSLESLAEEVETDQERESTQALLRSSLARAKAGEIVQLPPGMPIRRQHAILRQAADAGYGLDRIKPGTFNTTGVLDNFNRADGQTLGANWANNLIAIYSGTTQDAAITSNQVDRLSSGQSAVGLHYGSSTYGPDVESYLTMVAIVTGDDYMVYGRIAQPGTSTHDGYLAYYTNGNPNRWRVRRIDNGSFTTLATKAESASAGDKLGLEVIGSTVAVYRYTSGAWQLQASATDSTYSSAGYIGFYFPGTTSNAAIDDYGGGTVVSGSSVTTSTGAVVAVGLALMLATSVGAGVGTTALTGAAPLVSVQQVVTTAPRTLTLTGLQPSLSITQLAVPGLGTVALTGQGPTVQEAFAVTPSTRTTTATGASPSVQTALAITPGPGSLTLEGLAPSVTTGQSVAPAGGAATLTGLAPAVAEAVSRTLTQGSLLLTGAAPILEGSVSLIPTTGGVTAAGLVPTVEGAGTLTPSTRALTLAGSAPSVLVNETRTIGTGAASLTGLTPTAATAISVTPAGGAVTANGSTPTVSTGMAITPTPRTVLATGLSPTITRADSIIVSAGAMTVTGLPASLGGVTEVFPGVAPTVLTGMAPTVARADVVSAQGGTATLFGLAPVLTVAVTQIPSASVISVMGLAPTLVTADSIAVGGATASLNGFAPTLDVLVPGTVEVSMGVLTVSGMAAVVELGTAPLYWDGNIPVEAVRAYPDSFQFGEREGAHKSW